MASASMALGRPHNCRLGGHELTRPRDLACQRGEWRNMIVPLDQRGCQMSPRQRTAVKSPHDVTDGPAVVVNQEPGSFAVAIFGKACEVELADMLHGKSIDVSRGIEPVIDRGNMHI